MPSSLFTTSQVAQLTGLSVKQLNHWAQRELFVPSGQQSHGPGTRKLYTTEDIVQLLALKRLKCYRWSTRKIEKAVNMLRGIMASSDPPRSSMLLADSATMIAVCRTKADEQIFIDALVPGGQQVLSIAIETMEEESQHAIRKLLDCTDSGSEK